MDATYAYGNWVGGHDFEHRRDRLRALVLLMRRSGLAIKDAVTLERQRIDAEGNLFLYRAKTGVPVNVPLPPRKVPKKAMPLAVSPEERPAMVVVRNNSVRFVNKLQRLVNPEPRRQIELLRFSANITSVPLVFLFCAGYAISTGHASTRLQAF